MGVLTSGTQEAFLSQRSTSLFKPKKQNKETKAKKNQIHVQEQTIKNKNKKEKQTNNKTKQEAQGP